MKALFGGVALVLVVSLAWFFMGRVGLDMPKAPTPAAATTPQPSHQILPVRGQSLAEEGRSDRQVSSVGRFGGKRAADLFSLAKKSNDPSVIEEGYLAAARCAIVREEPELRQPPIEKLSEENKRRHSAARKTIVEFCDGLDVDGFSKERLFVARNGAAKGSKHLELIFSMMDSSRHPEEPVSEDSRMCGWLVAAKDNPEILRTLIPALVNVSRETLYGLPYSGYMRGVFNAALDMAACRLGSPCGLTSDWLAIRACGLYGACEYEDLSMVFEKALASDQIRADARNLSEYIAGDIVAGRCDELIAARFR